MAFILLINIMILHLYKYCFILENKNQRPEHNYNLVRCKLLIDGDSLV